MRGLQYQLTNRNRERDEFSSVRDHGRYGHGQDDARASADPQKVFDRQQRRNSKTRRFVLPYDVVAACKGQTVKKRKTI